MNLNLDSIVLVKPEAYEKMDKSGAEGFFKAEQRVLAGLKDGLIDVGEQQIKAKTNYTNGNLPDESPTDTEFSLDGIDFKIVTSVRVTNPKYQTVVDQINSFIGVLLNDWNQSIRKDNVRTYDKQAFVEWNYFMRNALWYLATETKLGVTNQFDKDQGIVAPAEFDESLDKLVIPVELMKDFDIDHSGAAKLLYQARKFYDEVNAASVEPVKDELKRRAAVEEMPAETQKHWEQVSNYLFVVQSVPSPRRKPGDVIKGLYKIPQKRKEKGALPVIVGPDNFQQLLEDFREQLPKSMNRWKKLHGNIGELVVFYYGIENHEMVQEQMPQLSEYKVRRDNDGKIFLSVEGVYNRMTDLGERKTDRLLRRLSTAPVV